MTIIDKHQLLPRLADSERVELELGCGNRKRDKSWIGIDALDFDDVDLVGDVFEVLAQFRDGSVDAVHAFHFFEHVADLPALLKELARVLKKDGALEVVVPHFSNPYFYSDYTHKQFFGLYSFSYLADDAIMKRRVPQYIPTTAFRLSEVDLNFKSSPPFYVRHGFKKMLGALFNLNNYMRELYEENYSALFPCYEIRFLLRRK